MRKWFILAGVGITVGLGGCKKPEVSEQPSATPPPPPSAEATPAPAPVVAATPAPAAVATPAPVVVKATPAPPELAPPGVFYLIAPVSIETSDGILGLKPGQPLRLIRPGVYRADANEVNLRPDQVTNNMTVARQLVAQDQKTQAALLQRNGPVAAQMPPGAPPVSGGSIPTAPTVPAAPQIDRKVAARNEILRQRQAIDAQLAQLQLSMNQYATKYGGQSLATKRSPQAAQLAGEMNTLQQKRLDLDSQLAALQ